MSKDIEFGRSADVGMDKNLFETNITDSFGGVDSVLSSNHVVVFGKSFCPFSVEMRRSLAFYGVPYAVAEVDKLPGVQSELKARFGTAVLPLLVVDSEMKGGIDDFKAAEQKHELYNILSGYVTRPKGSREDVRVHKTTTLFWHPDSVDNNVAIAIAVIEIIYSVLCVAFWERTAVRFAVLAFAIDSLARTMLGPKVSISGASGQFFVALLRPNFVPGSLKQVDSAIASFFTIFASGLWLGDEKLGGAIVLGVFIGVAALELILALFQTGYGALMAKFLFWMALPVFPPSAYRAHINTKFNKMQAWSQIHDSAEALQWAVNERVYMRGQVAESDVDLIRKPRREMSYKNKHVDAVRFTRVELFTVPMTLAALAYVFFLLTGATLLESGMTIINWGDSPKKIYQAIGITAGCVFVGQGIVYLTRFGLFPKKVTKEWIHPTSGNFFSAINICLALFGLLMFEHDKYFGVAMVWIGSVAQMCLSVSIAARMVFTHHSDEVLNPSIMFAPLGNFFCAWALASYPFHAYYDLSRITSFGVNYVFIARFWAAVAMLFALVMFTITFKKTFTDNFADERLRNTIWIWQAVAGVAGPTLYAVAGEGFAVGKSFAYQFFWLVGMFFFAVNCVGWMRGFYTMMNDCYIWLMPFANCCMAMSTIHYYSFVSNDQTVLTFVFFSVAIACASTVLCTIYTALAVVDLSLFKARPKQSPLSLLPLTYEALRAALPQLESLVCELAPEKPHLSVAFQEAFDSFHLAYEAHIQQRDSVLLPAALAFFPRLEIGDNYHEEKMKMQKLVADADSVRKRSNDATTKIRTTFAEASKIVSENLLEEELMIWAVLRKYTSLERQKELLSRAYDIVPSERWSVVLPYLLSKIPAPAQKTRFIRSLLWAMPERAQELGMLLYRTIDSVQFAALADEIPDIVPRGAYGYTKKH